MEVDQRNHLFFIWVVSRVAGNCPVRTDTALLVSSCPVHTHAPPPLGPYCRPMPRVRGVPRGWAFSYERGTPVQCISCFCRKPFTLLTVTHQAVEFYASRPHVR